MNRLLADKHSRRWLLPYLLALAALANLAYPMYLHYDFSHSLDTRSYLRMASGRFDSVSVTRRYRVVVPAAAAVVAVPFAQVYGRVWPQRPVGHWPMRFAFYLVNCCLMAAAAACWFNAARQAGALPEAAGLAVLATLTSRWAQYAAGLPLTDSLYLLVIALGYYAAKRGQGAGWALAGALILGPLAKESFIFLLPWLWWFGRPALPWPRQVLALAIGSLALGLVHYGVNARVMAPAGQSVSNALEHLANIAYSIRRASSPKGIGELLSIFGLFTFLPLLLVARNQWQKNAQPVPLGCGSPGVWLLLIVAVHMLLSGDLGRMGYLAAPVFVVALALGFTHWRILLRR